VGTEEWYREWVAALDALEADVTEVESLLSTDHALRDLPAGSNWTPPERLGTLPIDLRPRADAILQRQLAAARDLTLALATNRRHATMASRVEVGQAGPPRPAYLDCAA
jgi:hypothetical protein